MIQVNSIKGIKIGKTYQIDWEGIQQVVTVKSIEKSDQKTYKNSYYLNGDQRIDFFDMVIEEFEDADKIKWCRENCCGCDYCGGCKEDGSKCEQAPSKEAIHAEYEKNI